MKTLRLGLFWFLSAALALGAVMSVAAEVEVSRSAGFDLAYYPGDQQGFGVDEGGFAPITFETRESPAGTADGERVLGTTWGGVEAKGYYIQSWRIPALRWGEGALTADNNLTIRSATGVSPISVTQDLRVVAQPIAVLQFSAGALLGTGWNVQLFDGLGEVSLEDGQVDDSSFEGLVFRGSLGGTFQFDLAAVVPGEWNHVVTVISPQWTYNALTSADRGDPWSFEADGGTNYNGWTYKTTAFLGHQPPWDLLSTVGVLYEGQQLVGAAVNDAAESAPADFDPGFRDDRIGLVVNLTPGDRQQHSWTILTQFRRDRLADETTVFNAGAQRRETVGGYWDFYRVAVQYRYQFD